MTTTYLLLAALFVLFPTLLFDHARVEWATCAWLHPLTTLRLCFRSSRPGLDALWIFALLYGNAALVLRFLAIARVRALLRSL